jgi:hypothetical protein
MEDESDYHETAIPTGNDTIKTFEQYLEMRTSLLSEHRNLLDEHEKILKYRHAIDRRFYVSCFMGVTSFLSMVFFYALAIATVSGFLGSSDIKNPQNLIAPCGLACITTICCGSITLNCLKRSKEQEKKRYALLIKHETNLDQLMLKQKIQPELLKQWIKDEHILHHHLYFCERTFPTHKTRCTISNNEIKHQKKMHIKKNFKDYNKYEKNPHDKIEDVDECLNICHWRLQTLNKSTNPTIK